MREEEEEEQKAVLEQVFGESSSSDDDSDGEDSDSDSDWKEREWECVEEVKGLWVCRDFLPPHRQSSILSAIEADNWFPHSSPSTNQAMRFGLQHLPLWALHLSRSIRRSLLLHHHQYNNTHFPLHRQPLFDQMIVNVYQPGDGICPHVDLLRFDDGIAILSLQSSCVMHFTPLHSEPKPDSVPVLLTPGSLVLMSGDARYRWKHEINRRPGFQLWEGQTLTQSKRTSITLRKLCPSP